MPWYIGFDTVCLSFFKLCIEAYPIVLSSVKFDCRKNLLWKWYLINFNYFHIKLENAREDMAAGLNRKWKMETRRVDIKGWCHVIIIVCWIWNRWRLDLNSNMLHGRVWVGAPSPKPSHFFRLHNENHFFSPVSWSLWSLFNSFTLCLYLSFLCWKFYFFYIVHKISSNFFYVIFSY